MKAGSMEALIGASQNMKLVSTPMRVYKEAERKGDTGAMERAMSYVTEYEKKAKDCSDKALEETGKELKEERKEQEIKLEKIRKERKEQEAQCERMTDEQLQRDTAEDYNHIIDSVDISEEGMLALEKQNLSGEKSELLTIRRNVEFDKSV